MYLKFNGIQAGGWGELHVVDLPAPEDDLDPTRTDNLSSDGQLAGADYLRKAVWNITLLVNTWTYKDGRRVVNAVRDAWLDPNVRLSTETFPLEYSKNGIHWFKVYGRPTKYGGPPEGVRLDQGLAHIELQFEQLDLLHYSTIEETATARVARGASGGIRIHDYGLRAPLTVGRTGGVRNERVVNSGDREAWALVRFNGPCKNPWIRLGESWRLEINGTLAWDEFLEIDSRSRIVELKRTTGHSVRPAYNMIGKGSRISTLTIPPGSNALVYSSLDDTQQASVDVKWTHTFSSMQHTIGDEQA